MRVQRIIGALLALGLGCGEDPAPPPPPAQRVPPPPPARDPTLVARGRYLAESVMGCPLCHTPAPDRWLAGGLEFADPTGAWRSPNITPDERTGIGAWSDDEIVAAIREGRRPDGSRLYPIMPYMFYGRLSDADARALVAYLRAVRPVENLVAKNELALPRPPAPAPRGAEPGPSDPDLGEYYATLMTCAHCHTPMTPDGPDPSMPYAGGQAFELPGGGVLYSPNLTPAPKTGIGKRTEADLVAAIVKLEKPDGTPIRGPMSRWAASWRTLDPAHARAIAKFLRSLTPIEHEVPRSTFEPAAAPR